MLETEFSGQNKMADWIPIIVYLSMLGLSFYGLSAVDFSRIVYTTRPVQAQILYILCAMALAYLSASFLLNLSL